MTSRLNRRSFIATGAAGAAAVATAAGLKQRLGGEDTLEGLTAQRMRELASDAFTIAPDRGTGFTAKLIEVREAALAPVEGRRAPFDVLFSGPSSSLLEDGIYRIEHPDLRASQPLEVFLVRIGPDIASPVYQAIFA